MANYTDALKAVNAFAALCQTALVSGSDADFAHMIADAEHGLSLESRRGVAALLRVSPASVTRYAQGKNAPHPLMRETFCRMLLQTAREREDDLMQRLQAQRIADQTAAVRSASRQGTRRTPLTSLPAVPAFAAGMRASGRQED